MKEIKQKIRRRISDTVRAGSLEEQRRAAQEIWHLFFQTSIYAAARTFLVYSGIPGEVDTTPLIKKLKTDNRKILLPYCKKKGILGLGQVADETDVITGAYGIPEPRHINRDTLSLNAIDCIIVPGVAFDRNGNRLGRGQGYYDRLIVQKPAAAVTVSPVFPEQIIDEIPRESHDCPVDAVIAPRHIFYRDTAVQTA
ncbi:MAG: 5-formyltetrahydrofolate cyclo-ligase [Fibrobacterota bacterium]|jgi:5-formyltetrahydrofolate cyclo-ligase